MASLLAATSANAQTFTKVTTGPIVTDGLYSEGALWGDVNGDDHLDLFVGNIVNQVNRLYLGDGAGGFTEVLAGSVVTDLGFTYGGNLGDFDNDGDLDLVAINGGSSTNQANFYYENDGAGSFTKITSGALVTDLAGSWSSCAADVDGDGNLDVFVANYNQNNALYLGIGDGSFSKVTSGDIVTNGGASLGSAFADVDHDGAPDLFVANANFGAGVNNFFYENNGDGTFTRLTTGDLVSDGGNSVAPSFVDIDNDRDLDLFVTNYFGEDNFLYENDGSGAMTRVLAGVIASDGGSSVCAAFADIDNDGDQDLFVSNDLNEDNALYTNQGSSAFVKVGEGDIVNDGGRSNGSSWADVDGDGDLDLVVTNGDQPVAQSNFFYINNGDALQNGNWIALELIGTLSNRSAIGARVSARAAIGGEPVWQTHEVSGQTGYNAQSSLIVELGFGTSAVIDTLIVEWPSGQVDALTNLATNANLLIVEQGQASVAGGAPHAAAAILAPNRPNPFNPRTTITYALPSARHVRLDVFDAHGRPVATLVDGYRTSGAHSIEYDAGGIPSGAYFVRLEAGTLTRTRKIMLVR